MFYLDQELIIKVNDIFLAGEDLKIIVWMFMIFYIYNFYKNCTVNKRAVVTEERKISKEKIAISFARCKIMYGEDVKLKDDKNKLIVYSIMILNNYERPSVLRKIDNTMFKINGLPRKLGIMQILSKKFITDSESIEIVCKKIDKLCEKSKGSKVKNKNYKDVFVSYDKKSSEKLIYIYEELEKFSFL